MDRILIKIQAEVGKSKNHVVESDYISVEILKFVKAHTMTNVVEKSAELKALDKEDIKTKREITLKKQCFHKIRISHFKKDRCLDSDEDFITETSCYVTDSFTDEDSDTSARDVSMSEDKRSDLSVLHRNILNTEMKSFQKHSELIKIVESNFLTIIINSKYQVV